MLTLTGPSAQAVETKRGTLSQYTVTFPPQTPPTTPAEVQLPSTDTHPDPCNDNWGSLSRTNLDLDISLPTFAMQPASLND